MNTQYRLFYKEVNLGEFISGDSDFPNMSGKFHSRAEADHETTRRHVHHYIEYCIAADKLMHSGDDAAWEEFIEKNEAQFLDLIETDDWTLRDENEVIPILVPVFYQNNEVVWRLNSGL